MVENIGGTEDDIYTEVVTATLV